MNMSTSNAEIYRNIIECHNNLVAGNVLSLAHVDALNYMRNAAIEKLEAGSKLVAEIDNETMIDILNNHFIGNGIKFEKPDNNVLPTIRIKIANTKYVKDDSSISLTDEFYKELHSVLNKYKIPAIQWNNNRTSFWWTPII